MAQVRSCASMLAASVVTSSPKGYLFWCLVELGTSYTSIYSWFLGQAHQKDTWSRCRLHELDPGTDSGRLSLQAFAKRLSPLVFKGLDFTCEFRHVWSSGGRGRQCGGQHVYNTLFYYYGSHRCQRAEENTVSKQTGPWKQGNGLEMPRGKG